MTTVSCFYYRLWRRQQFNFTFIKFEKFVKIILDRKVVILTNKELVSNPELFKIFLLSLLLTENTSKVDSVINNNKIIYGITSFQYLNSSQPKLEMRFNEFEKSKNKNPLNARAPIRTSSDKKIRKFFKSFDKFYDNDMIIEPKYVIEDYLDDQAIEVVNYFNKYIEHECMVLMLSSIFHNFGQDVYASVNWFI